MTRETNKRRLVNTSTSNADEIYYDSFPLIGYCNYALILCTVMFFYHVSCQWTKHGTFHSLANKRRYTPCLLAKLAVTTISTDSQPSKLLHAVNDALDLVIISAFGSYLFGKNVRFFHPSNKMNR